MNSLLSPIRSLFCALAIATSPLCADTAINAPTRTIEVSGIRFAYRRIGAETGTPLVLLNHSRGTLDSWDPLLVDALAKTRPVILFDNAGVGGSTGTTPDTFAAMARDAISFIYALNVEQVDLLGFSIGGCVAQEIALQAPDLVRRMVLAATAPEGGEDVRLTGKARDVFLHSRSASEAILYLFFSPSETSQAAGAQFIERRARRQDRVPTVTDACGRAQFAAREAWGEPNPASYVRLAAIRQPVLVANGNNDVMMQTKNSLILAQHLPNGMLLVYPDSGHGFLFQYPEQFADDVARFLSRG